MKKQLVYDLPTRIFHSIFSTLFVGAFFITKAFETDSPIFPYHMLIGIILCFAVSLRILWGLIGTRHARFSDFQLHPAKLKNYLKSIYLKQRYLWAGHNPASSWTALLMMTCALGLGGTGYLMVSTSNREAFEEIHELLGNSLLILAILHVSGILLHTFKYRDHLAFSIINGKKENIPAEEAIPSPHTKLAIGMLLLIAIFGTLVFKGYDNASQKLQIFGYSLQLGEKESSENEAPLED